MSATDPPGSKDAYRWDPVWAAVSGGAALAVYVRTCAPGLIAIMDTPMFQFVGRVLGVAHNPGYPAYVLLSHPFSYLPVGSLAYRLNLLSALLGAVTSGLACVIARRLGCGRVVSMSAALALAFGRVYWSQAVIAEVYTLNTAIISGMLLALLVWGRTRRSGFLFAAFALLALGLGNHTTIVGFAPGMVVYALVTDRKFVTRVRTLGTLAAILLAGLLQYGFIIVRSRQPSAYVESRATTVQAVFDVMRGKQFGYALFTFDWRTALFHRVPWLVGSVLTSELTIPGIVMASVGALVLLRRRVADGLLLLLGWAAIVGFVVNYDAPDIQVFLIPAILVSWLCAAVGAEAAARLAASYRRRAGTLVVAAALCMPLWQLSHNFGSNDMSRQTEAQAYFESLFDALPDRTVLLREDFLVDRMLNYKLVGEGSAKGRHIQLEWDDTSRLSSLFAEGFRVFGFQHTRKVLGYRGFDFDFGAYAVTGDRLPQFLSRLPNGSIVAIAVPAVYAERLAVQSGALFESIGGSANLAGRTQSNIAIVGARGARRGALERIDARNVILNVAPHARIGTTGVAPLFIQVRADSTEATIRLGLRDLVRTTEGATMVYWSPDGILQETFVLQAANDFRVPAVMSSLSLRPLRGIRRMQPLTAATWTDLRPVVATGSLMVRVAPGATVMCYVGADEPLAPRAIDRSSNSLIVDITSFDRGATADLRLAIQRDEADGSGFAGGQKNVYRIQMTAPPGTAEPMLVQVALGGIPAQAVGRVSQSGSASGAGVFSINTGGLLRTPDRVTEILGMARDEQAQLIGDGWSLVESDETGPYRWTTGPQARLLLPLATDAQWIRVQALLPKIGPGEPSSVWLRLNGIDVPSQPLLEGWHPYQWALPPGVLRKGVNEAAVVVERKQPGGGDDVSARGIAIADITVGHRM